MKNGLEIRKIVEMKVGKEYTGYYDRYKLNRLLEIILYKIIDQKADQYRQTQKIADAIQPIIKYGRQLSVVGNKIPISPIIVKSISVVGPIVTMVLDSDTNDFQNGDSIVFNSDLQGMTGIIANPTVLSIANNTVTFNNISAPTGSYVDYSGKISNNRFIVDYYRLLNLSLLFAGRTDYRFIVNPDYINGKGKIFGGPSVLFPKMELAGNYINIEPDNITCTNAKLFYISKPKIMFDVDDEVFDYENYWSPSFINHITDVAAKHWSGYIKDPDAFKFQDILISENP